MYQCIFQWMNSELTSKTINKKEGCHFKIQMRDNIKRIDKEEASYIVKRMHQSEWQRWSTKHNGTYAQFIILTNDNVCIQDCNGCKFEGHEQKLIIKIDALCDCKC
eukprot:504221_1